MKFVQFLQLIEQKLRYYLKKKKKKIGKLERRKVKNKIKFVNLSKKLTIL